MFYKELNIIMQPCFVCSEHIANPLTFSSGQLSHRPACRVPVLRQLVVVNQKVIVNICLTQYSKLDMLAQLINTIGLNTVVSMSQLFCIFASKYQYADDRYWHVNNQNTHSPNDVYTSTYCQQTTLYSMWRAGSLWVF